MEIKFDARDRALVHNFLKSFEVPGFVSFGLFWLLVLSIPIQFVWIYSAPWIGKTLMYWTQGILPGSNPFLFSPFAVFVVSVFLINVFLTLFDVFMVVVLIMNCVSRCHSEYYSERTPKREHPKKEKDATPPLPA